MRRWLRLMITDIQIRRLRRLKARVRRLRRWLEQHGDAAPPMSGGGG